MPRLHLVLLHLPGPYFIPVDSGGQPCAEREEAECKMKRKDMSWASCGRESTNQMAYLHSGHPHACYLGMPWKIICASLVVWIGLDVAFGGSYWGITSGGLHSNILESSNHSPCPSHASAVDARPLHCHKYVLTCILWLLCEKGV